MDNLNRWAIGLGAGVLTGMILLGGHYVATASVTRAAMSDSIDRLIPRFISLDASIELDTFDAQTYTEALGQLHEIGADALADCGGYLHPAHACIVDATIPDALRLREVKPGVIRNTYSLTIGEYRSDYEALLTAANTVKVDTGTGLRPITYEGNGTFSLGYLGRSPTNGKAEGWQFALAAVPAAPVWLTVGSFSTVVAVLVAACFRPRREPEADAAGVEVFDVLYESD